MNFVPTRNNTYRMEERITWIITSELYATVSEWAHAQLSKRDPAKTNFYVPYERITWNNVLYTYKLYIYIRINCSVFYIRINWLYYCRAGWMKGICHIWSRGRHFSPSLSDLFRDERYLKLGSQKQPAGRNFGGNRLVRRSCTASRGTALLEFFLRMCSFSRTEVFNIFMGEK